MRKEMFHLLPSDTLGRHMVQEIRQLNMTLPKFSPTLPHPTPYPPYSCMSVFPNCFCRELFWNMSMWFFLNLKIISYQNTFIKPLCCPMDRCGFPRRGLEFLLPILVNSCEPFHFNSLDSILIHNIELICSPNFFPGS